MKLPVPAYAKAMAGKSITCKLLTDREAAKGLQAGRGAFPPY